MRLGHIYKHIKFLLFIFIDKELTLFAASLSFYTLLTIVPLLFITITLITSLESFSGLYTNIQALLFENLLPGNSERVMQYFDGFLQNSSKMGTISSIFLFISSLLFFKNYEYVANKIFRAQQRSFLSSLGVYISLLTITPLSLGFAFYITGYVANLMASNSLTSGFDILKLLPYIIIWVLFFIIFKLSVNIKISFRAAIISSFIISIVFNLAKNSFVYYVFYNKAYASIYGSFSILLFLFLWIYISWLIFIYGLRLCHIINRIHKEKKTQKY
jgi:membrane protein